MSIPDTLQGAVIIVTGVTTATVAFAYTLGFVVVNTYLNQFGVTEYGFTRWKYLEVGLWFLWFNLTYFAGGLVLVVMALAVMPRLAQMVLSLQPVWHHGLAVVIWLAAIGIHWAAIFRHPRFAQRLPIWPRRLVWDSLVGVLCLAIIISVSALLNQSPWPRGWFEMALVLGLDPRVVFVFAYAVLGLRVVMFQAQFYGLFRYPRLVELFSYSQRQPRVRFVGEPEKLERLRALGVPLEDDHPVRTKWVTLIDRTPEYFIVLVEEGAKRKQAIVFDKEMVQGGEFSPGR